MKPYNNGEWTAARMHAFIKSALRNASLRWPPKSRVKKAAWVSRGVYRCAGYNKDAHEITASTLHNNKRINNVFVDHIEPVIDPEVGFTSWDDTIRRMFCEDEQLQVLCKDCHDSKSADEKRKRN